jgi:hypothetical protein
VSTATPPRLEEHLPFIRVSRGPGSDDYITASTVIDLDVLAASESHMWALAEQCRLAMHALGGQKVAGVQFDSISTASGPTAVSWGNPAIERAVLSARVNVRRIRRG